GPSDQGTKLAEEPPTDQVARVGDRTGLGSTPAPVPISQDFTGLFSRPRIVAMNAKILFGLLKDTIREWNNDKAPRMGAALAYYTVFSLAPLLFIAIAIAGLVFGEQAARGEIVNELADTLGRPAARAVE